MRALVSTQVKESLCVFMRYFRTRFEYPEKNTKNDKQDALLITEKEKEFLTRALKAERTKAEKGHWSYDLNRHLSLIKLYKENTNNSYYELIREP